MSEMSFSTEFRLESFSFKKTLCTVKYLLVKENTKYSTTVWIE